MVTIHKPIMIVCAGRSGSTMYYRIIARHKDVGWLSTYNEVFPKHLWLSIFSRLYGKSIFNGIRDKSFFPKPFSPYKFWSQQLPGIDRHDRPLFPEDVPEKAIDALRHTVLKALRYQNKTRFLMKVTGWARMAYFERIFPEIRFIYLKRNPLDVVSSWIQAGWLNVTSELNSGVWEWGEVPEEYRQIWQDLGGGGLLSAAIKTQLDRDDLRRNVNQFPGRCFELNYEDLVVEPRKYLRQTLEFCELDWYHGFEDVIKATRIHSYVDKWRQYISEADSERVREFFRRAEQVHI